MKSASIKYILASVFFAGATYSRFITPQYAFANESCSIRANDTQEFLLNKGFPVTDYACLIPYVAENTDVNPDNSVCFYGNDDKLICVAARETKYKECDKENRKFNYNSCVKKIFKLGQEEDYWNVNLKSYPDKERVTSDKELIKNECVKTDHGVFIEDKDGKYVCLDRPVRHYLPAQFCFVAGDEAFDEDGYKLSSDYCVNNELSNIKICNIKSSKASYSQCYKKLRKLSPELSKMEKIDYKSYNN